MSSPTLSSFLLIFAIVVALIVWWRVAVIVVAALVITLLVTGVDAVLHRAAAQPAPTTADIHPGSRKHQPLTATVGGITGAGPGGTADGITGWNKVHGPPDRS